MCKLQRVGPIVPHPALRRMDSIVVTQSNNMNAPPAPSPAQPPKQANGNSAREDRTFHLFPYLPAELRAKVWEYATTPRVVCVAYNPSLSRVESDTPIPALLGVNQESRYEALRSYKPLFQSKSNEAYTLFNAKIDTLYFPRHREMGYDDTLRDFATYMAHPEDLGQVRRIALDSVDNGVKRPWEAYDKAVLIKSFPNLETLYLVLKRKEIWLSNLPRDFLGEKTKAREIKFVDYEDTAEAGKVGGEFEMQFNREEQMLQDIWRSEGMNYEIHRLPPVCVVEKRRLMA